MRVETSAGSLFIDWHHQESDAQIYAKYMTTCFIKNETLEMKSDGIAICSIKDNFDKDKGRKISLARAIDRFSKPVRTEIWKAYLNRKELNAKI